jgi:hypothetical protein
LSIVDDAGDSYPDLATVDCSTCTQTGTPILCYRVERVGDGGVSHVWDGTLYTPSQCGHGMGCWAALCAPPGRYEATMCACATDSTAPCSGGRCFTIPFDFPSSTPITATLP